MKAEEWVVDSGATTHMMWDKGVYVTYIAMDNMPSVRLGDGHTVKAEGRVSVRFRVKDNQEAERVIRLTSVLFVPDLSCNLFSVRSITDKGNRMFETGRLMSTTDCHLTEPEAMWRYQRSKWTLAAMEALRPN